MNCPDLKAYVLGEASAEENLEIRRHLEVCTTCGLETERLRVATQFLRSLPEEEIPVHIRFVSDKVFEPRWWQRPLMANFGVLAFLIPLLMIASAFLGARFAAPRPRVTPQLQTASVSSAEIDRRVQAAVDARMRTELAKVVSFLDHHEDEREHSLLATFKHQEQADHNRLLFQVDNAYRSVDLKVNQFAYLANEKVPSVAAAGVIQ